MRERYLGMRAGADAEVVAELPVVQVVPRLAPGLRIGRHFIMSIAGGCGVLLDHLLHVGAGIVVRQHRRELRENRVRLQRQVVQRQVRRRRGNRDAKVGARLFQRLPGQRIHQVEIEIVEMPMRDLDGATRLCIVMNAAERLQMFAVEALNTDRQTVDPAVAIRPEAFRFEGAGVGFHRDLGCAIQRQQGADIGHQAVEAGGRHQARRAATDEDGVDLAAPDQRQRVFQVEPQGVEVGALRHRVGRLVRIEVAIRTFLHAPRVVHVERQRRQRRQVEHPRLEVGVRRFGRADCRSRSCSRFADGLAVGADRRDWNHRNFSTSARNAWPRCDSRFFSAASSSPAVFC